MLETLGAVVAVLGAMGFSGLLGAYAQHKFQQHKQVSDRVQELKEKRYLCIITLMLIRLQPVASRKMIAIRPDLEHADDVHKELQSELLNAMMFAGDDVVRSAARFIKAPSHAAFAAAASAMRSDLWRDKHQIPADIVELVSATTATEAESGESNSTRAAG